MKLINLLIIVLLTFAALSCSNANEIGKKQIASKTILKNNTNSPTISRLNPVQFKNAFKDPLTFGKFMMQEISTQIPIYLTMAATGNVAPIVIGMSSSGSKLSDMKADIAMGEANYSSTDMAFKSLLYGVVEAGLGTVPSVGIINKNKSRFLKGLKNRRSFVSRN